MKKSLCLILLFTVMGYSVNLLAQATPPKTNSTEKQPMYSTLIKNDDGSFNLAVIIVLKSLKNIEDEESKYSTLGVLVSNNGNSKFKWSDYKVYIMLKDGTLFHNYTTKTTDESSEYLCNYTVEADKYRIQRMGFSKIFKSSDIEKVWVSFGDNLFRQMVYSVE